ncbi:SOS response-associated peptidase [Falsiroseomonas tokyonensis]|uniref:Abasic site processing protein n=1 Tax=Falsiroseomonas tokyonensis TaxID=430521 RepID=A0ABV7C5U8_9PROT|nr:SOS response-associated peptidase [Falsiroseomonas tokyonensis]MBU8541807.1 SOS response-associated peptidase [Falsiroseomonas tokyonensis]
MCGRFTQRYTWAELHALLDLIGSPRNLRPRHNIAPTTSIDMVRAGEAGRELAAMRWGLIPAWWKKSAQEVPATFNARAETVAEKPMFRDGFKRRRCIIPASCFYEWTGGRKDRQPHPFTAADGASVPGLGEGGVELHHDRVGRQDGTLGAEALHPARATALREGPVSKRKNATSVATMIRRCSSP